MIPTLDSKEFEFLFKNFIKKDFGVEADTIFIHLFLDGTDFSCHQTISKRIIEYIRTNPKEKKAVCSIIDELLNFMVEKEFLAKCECKKESRKIRLFLKNNC